MRRWQSAQSAIRSSAVVACAGGYWWAQWCTSTAGCWPHPWQTPRERAKASSRACRKTGWWRLLNLEGYDDVASGIVATLHECWARRVAVSAAARHFPSDTRTIAHPPEAGESPGLLGNQRPSVRVQPGPPIVLAALPSAATVAAPGRLNPRGTLIQR